MLVIFEAEQMTCDEFMLMTPVFDTLLFLNETVQWPMVEFPFKETSDAVIELSPVTFTALNVTEFALIVEDSKVLCCSNDRSDLQFIVPLIVTGNEKRPQREFSPFITSEELEAPFTVPFSEKEHC